MKIEDLMTRNVRTVTVDHPLKDVAALLAEHGIGGMPVTDEDGRAVGMVCSADIVIKQHAEMPASAHRKLFGRHSDEQDAIASKVSARTAGEAMSSPVIAISPELPTSLAADKMLADGVNRLLVMRNDEIVGIITRHDLVRAFARSDAELEREIRAETARDLSWPDALEISVSGGEVTLRGEVDSVYDAQALPKLVRKLPGVV